MSFFAPMLEYCDITTGKLDSNAAITGGEYPFFTCSPETLRINTFAFDTEAVLLAGNNASGVFSVKYWDGKFNAYQRTYVIQSSDESKLSTRFLFFALQMQLTRLQNLSTGAATKFLTLGILKKIEIPIPDKVEQLRVVNVLSTYDDLIGTNRLRIALLEESARLLYREWFVKLRFPGHELVEVVDGVPKGWRKGQLLDLCCEIRDQVDPASLPHDTPYLSMEHMPQNSICLGEWETSQKVTSAKLRFNKLDILFGKIRPYFHKVGIAQTMGITSTDVIVARAKRELFLSLLALTMSSEEFVAYSVVTSNGTKMPRANWKVLQHWQILIPDDAVLYRFSEFTMPVITALANLSEQNIQLREARDAILPKLMSGQLAV